MLFFNLCLLLFCSQVVNTLKVALDEKKLEGQGMGLDEFRSLLESVGGVRGVHQLTDHLAHFSDSNDLAQVYSVC